MTRKLSLQISIGIALFAGLAAISTGRGEERGRFVGQVVTEWLADGRSMRLLQPFEYVGPDGKRWPVPTGVLVDGASIPKVFWSLIGAPFSGQYRNASVIHDYYCDNRMRPYQEVHRVFYAAMLTSGVGENRAWLMFKAVEEFGPRWEAPKVDKRCEGSVDFDYELCAQAARKPLKVIPKLDKAALKRFADEVGGRAEADDLNSINAMIESLR